MTTYVCTMATYGRENRRVACLALVGTRKMRKKEKRRKELSISLYYYSLWLLPLLCADYDWWACFTFLRRLIYWYSYTVCSDAIWYFSVPDFTNLVFFKWFGI